MENPSQPLKKVKTVSAPSSSNGNGYANGAYAARWQLVLSAAGVAFIVLGSLIGLFVQLTTLTLQVSNLSLRLGTVETTTAATLDRGADMRTRLAQVESSLIEIETQFCAEDSVRNLSQAHDLRTVALLWEKVYGSPMQMGGSFYPQIGRCPGNARAPTP